MLIKSSQKGLINKDQTSRVETKGSDFVLVIGISTLIEINQLWVYAT